ncbi:MAG: 8-amino-7-oxononanoate synthase [Pseudoruegeria sp.]
MSRLARYETALQSLNTRGRLRALSPVQGHDFASNDYLGLAQSDILRDAAKDALTRGVPTGAGASRLLRGNHPEHEALETEAAAFFGTQAALYVAGGFTANVAMLSTLPAHNDLILHDALIHASSHDGMRLGRAEAQSFLHNDVTDAEIKANEWRAAGNTGLIWIAIESLYSMDGDLAPMADIVALADRLDAMIIADEAHATGVFGDLGRGVSHPYAHQENIVTLHTCGKSLGSFGGLICADTRLINTLINKSRGFIFSTAPAPLNAAITRAALRVLEQDPQRQKRLQQRIQRVNHGLGRNTHPSQIIPIILGDDKRTLSVASDLQSLGFDIRGIRPPTVPRGTSRLRLSITLNPDDQAVDDMVNAITNIDTEVAK